MTKCLHCQSCNTVRTFKADTSLTTCDCGKVMGWWHDPDAGIAYLATADQADRDLAAVLTLHNGFLNEGSHLVPQAFYDPSTQTQMPYAEAQTDGFWRQLHAHAAVAPRAPDSVRVFDASRRACWAVIVHPGATSDVVWASPAEIIAKGGHVATRDF